MPDKSVWIIQVSELTDDLHPERFLRFDEFPVEEIDQHIPLPRMQRVLPQLNDRAASLRRLRVRIFHAETLRREWNRRHQEFQRAQDRHFRINASRVGNGPFVVVARSIPCLRPTTPRQLALGFCGTVSHVRFNARRFVVSETRPSIKPFAVCISSSSCNTGQDLVCGGTDVADLPISPRTSPQSTAANARLSLDDRDAG